MDKQERLLEKCEKNIYPFVFSYVLYEINDKNEREFVLLSPKEKIEKSVVNEQKGHYQICKEYENMRDVNRLVKREIINDFINN